MSTPAGALPDNTAFAAASERSIDELLRLPLTLAATVLWLWGTFRVGSMWFLQEPTVAWIAAAGLSTVAGALLVGYVGGGWPRALGIPLLLGLWTLSGAAIVAGVGWPGLTVIATIYALATWSVGRWLLNHPLCQHVAGLLFGREVDAGVVERVEPRLRWWSIAISMGALALAVLNHAGLLLTPYAPLTELLGALLVTAGLLLWIGIATRATDPGLPARRGARSGGRVVVREHARARGRELAGANAHARLRAHPARVRSVIDDRGPSHPV